MTLIKKTKSGAIETKPIYLSARFKKVEMPIDQSDDRFIYIEGYASTNDEDRHGDIVKAEAWDDETLQLFMDNPVLLYNHNYNKIIGQVYSLEKDDKGLKVKARVYKTFEEIDKIEDGILKSFSIGFLIKKASYNEELDLFIISAVELLELSVVTVPANGFAVFSVSKQLEAHPDQLKALKKSFILKQKSYKMFEFFKKWADSMKAKFGVEIDTTKFTEESSEEDIQKEILAAMDSAKSITELVAEQVAEKTQELTTANEKLQGELDQLKETVEALESGDTDELSKSILTLQGAVGKLQKQVEPLEKSLQTALDDNKQLRKTIDDIILKGADLQEGESLLDRVNRGSKSFVDQQGFVEIEEDSKY